MTHWTNGEHAADLKYERKRVYKLCAEIAEQAAADHSDGEGEIYIARKIADAIRSAGGLSPPPRVPV